MKVYVADLHATGLAAAVREKVSPEARAVIDAPQAAPVWIDSHLVDEIQIAIADLAGRDGLREFGRRSMHARLGTLLEPVTSFVSSWVGSSPGDFYSRADSMAQVVLEGVRVRWKPRDGNSGTVRIEAVEALPEACWALWEGLMESALTLNRAEGAVHRARPSADGLNCEIDVEWKTSAR